MTTCSFCKGEMPDGATVCLHCSRETPESRRRRSGRWWQVLGVIVLVVVGALVILEQVGEHIGPKTYQDVARDAATRCVENNGYGGWVGSSGLTLAEYCRGYGAVRATVQLRQDHPEKF